MEFQTHVSTVTVSCGKSSFTLKTLDAADFPPFPNVDVSSSIEVPFAEFCSMVKRVAKVVSKDQSRAVLTGVLISTSDEGLRMVATDSYRLAVADIALEGVQENFEAIVSGVFLQEVCRPAEDGRKHYHWPYGEPDCVHLSEYGAHQSPHRGQFPELSSDYSADMGNEERASLRRSSLLQ